MSLLVTRNFGSFLCEKRFFPLACKKKRKLGLGFDSSVFSHSCGGAHFLLSSPSHVDLRAGLLSWAPACFFLVHFFLGIQLRFAFASGLKERKKERKCLVKGAQEDGLHLARWGVVRLRQHRCITLRLRRPCSRVAVEDRCLEVWLAPSRKEWRSGLGVPWRIEPWIPSWDRAPFSTNMRNRRDQGLQRRSRLRGPWIRVRTSPRLFRIV